jgi:hypothetical protein
MIKNMTSAEEFETDIKTSVNTMEAKALVAASPAVAVLQILFIDKFTDILINKDSFNKVHLFLSKNSLYISRREKKYLLHIYVKAIASNFIDITKLNSCLSTIDLKKAAQRFISVNNMLKAKILKKHKTEKISAYIPPQRIELSVQDKINQLKATVQIGFGLDSKITIKKIRRCDVLLDDNTKQSAPRSKNILYAAGWSLKDYKE